MIGSLLLAVLVPAMLVWLVIRLVGGGNSKRGMAQGDMRIIQEVHSDMAAMEKRIEALETILLDRIKER